ncbi:type VI-A CRISPR-associated RNA-guided ribonuclease Cas13a [Pectinatus haikarae]|uniref:type VI-A CRISPR-associated RNA-guided ribonuclease Cas13a n=1 Tax=Pectinatus haikarae TaxID=349096 RepID=UPI0018C7D4BA|nr:type VI-A CRISPR-associated RNA-guided ribonuclease Cas13a [Pectinatus haikarae]
MKLTRTKNSSNAVFYRDTQKGGLYISNNFAEDKTENIIKKLPFEASLTTRILSNPNKRKSYDQSKNNTTKFDLSNFINKLIKLGNVSLPAIKGNTFDPSKYLSLYGCNLTIEKDGETLGNLLKRHYEKNEDITEDLKIWHCALQERIAYKQKKLKESIKNNNIPFTAETDNKGAIQGLRVQWLYYFIKKDGIDFDCLKKYEELYEYEKLYANLCIILNNYYKNNLNADNVSIKSPQKLGEIIYRNVKEYHKNLYTKLKENLSANDLQDFNFYLDEIQEYFRHYFGSNKAKISLNKKYKVENLIDKNIQGSYRYIWIKTHLVNKINALLIQNGKLSYYLDDKNLNPTSNDLSDIQIKEAFKKQFILSITWAITRLNYFFDYGSNNSDLLGKNEASTGTKIEGDILQEFNKNCTLKDIYENIQKNTITDFTDITYIKYFLNGLIENRNNNKTILQEKLCTSFPLNAENDIQNIDIGKLLDILDAAKDSIEYLRNNIIHYKKDCLYTLIQSNEIVNRNYFSQIKTLFTIDKSHINDYFKAQFRSSLIANIFPLKILKQLFINNRLTFHIYAPKYTLMPSFRNIYKRGVNLCSMDKNNIRKLSWYNTPDLIDNDIYKKWQAYKNLLQLIYEHSFLPAIKNEKNGEALVTNFINETITMSEKVLKYNENTPGISQQNKYSRYSSMNKYRWGQSLANYMAELQRLQSTKESNKHDDINNSPKLKKLQLRGKNNNDKNYYIDFVQDIFVRAFDNYLETRLGSNVKNELQSIFNKDFILPKGNESEDTLNELFNKQNPILYMQNDLSITNYEDKKLCLLFYPFLRMLEKRELANLQHQVIRYRCSLDKRDKNKLSKEKCDEYRQSEKLEQLIAMLIFTFPDHINEDKCYEDMVNRHFSRFIGGNIKDYIDLYYQNDYKTPIQQKSMLALMRSGALPLYSDMFRINGKPIYEITKQNYDKYKEDCLLGTDLISPIEQVQETLRKLHDTLCKLGPKNTNNLKTINEYRNSLALQSKYINLRRKVTFDLLYEIHIVHVEILSRLASFAIDWERDMYFLLYGLNNFGIKRGEKILDLNKDNIDSIYNYEGSKIPIFIKTLKENGRNILSQFYWCNSSKKLTKNDFLVILRPRNALAHFNHMTQMKQGNENQPSIIELLPLSSKLLHYDLKRKNSITRVLKEVLKKHHITISLKKCDLKNTELEKYNSDEYKLISVKSDSINYLKNLNKSIPIQAKDDIFIDCIEKLLTFSYSDSQNNS